MAKPVLVIMAAGMGSRYGGLKQIDPIDANGHIIMDFSIYDARLAGFEEVVFIIKKENDADFKACIGDRIQEHVKVHYVFQEHVLPQGFSVPEGRVKPFGTGHAILSCLGTVKGPFAVINADDFYGRSAFATIYDYLCSHPDDGKYRYAMVGYVLENTLTENGHVARGVCKTDGQGHLLEITERTHIEKHGDGTAYTEDEGSTWHTLEKGCTVSMNLWGFTESILHELEKRFPDFLGKNLERNPLKCEYLLPEVVSQLLAEDRATVEVLKSMDRWYGVTYHEDKATVMAAIARMKEEGLYPKDLWGNQTDKTPKPEHTPGSGSL